MQERLKTRVVREPAQLHQLSGDWAELWRRCAEVTPFQRPEWILSWVSTFSPANIFAIEVRRGDTLVGLAPLLIYSRGEDRVLAFMGGGVSDYLDMLVDPQCEQETVEAVFDTLVGIEGWNVFDLTDLPSNSVLNRTELSQFFTAHDSCSALALPNTNSELLQLLSKHQRANLRNARSRLDRAGGANVEIATVATVNGFLEDLFQLHTNRWSAVGESGVLADEQVRNFHRESAPKLLAAGLLRSYRLRTNQHTIAVLHMLLGSETVFCYMQGFDPEFSFVSPGTLLMFYAIKDAIQLGLKKFDFLRGEESYKQHWRAQSETTYRLQLPRSALNPSLLIREFAA